MFIRNSHIYMNKREMPELREHIRGLRQGGGGNTMGTCLHPVSFEGAPWRESTGAIKALQSHKAPTKEPWKFSLSAAIKTVQVRMLSFRSGVLHAKVFG